MISALNHKSAGASSNPSTSCLRQRPSTLPSRMGVRGAGARRITYRALRIEAEDHRIVRLQVGELPRLRQGDTKLTPRVGLQQENRGIRAVEQNALHLA